MSPSSPLFLRALLPTALAASALSSNADACSLAAPGTVVGSLPADGATDVPLDVQPVIVGQVQSLDVRKVLADADGGSSAVGFDVSEQSQAVEVLFDAPLEPHTQYEFEVGGWEGIQVLSFTTGSAEQAATDVPDVPDLVVSALVSDETSYWGFLCSSPTSFLCVGAATIPEQHSLVLRATNEANGVGSMFLTANMAGAYAYHGSMFDLYNEDPGLTLLSTGWEPGTCVEAFLQDVSGQRGPVTELCPGEFETHEVAFLQSVQCRGGQIEFDSTPEGEVPVVSEPGQDPPPATPVDPTPVQPDPTAGPDEVPPVSPVQTDPIADPDGTPPPGPAQPAPSVNPEGSPAPSDDPVATDAGTRVPAVRLHTAEETPAAQGCSLRQPGRSSNGALLAFGLALFGMLHRRAKR